MTDTSLANGFPYHRGIIATKAYPPHLGHLYLIRTARSMCDTVDVFLVYRPGENPPMAERYDMLRESIQDNRVTIIPVEDIETDDTTPESSVFWATYTKDIYDKLPSRYPDVVFSSEAYGPRWAAALGVEHVMVDRSRTAYPISGTMCRQDPFANWMYLPPAVRAHYAMRIAIVGPESTGKTTLAKHLAEHYGTVWVPEYGRLYVEDHAATIEEFEEARKSIIFPMILREQPRMEDELAREANRILICDTELITTDIWFDVWCPKNAGNALHQALKNRASEMHYTLYLLSVPEGAEWVDDGTRDQGRTREWFTWEFRKRLAAHGDPVVELSGSWDQRFYKAVDHINRCVLESGSKWEPPIPVQAPSGIGSFFPGLPS